MNKVVAISIRLSTFADHEWYANAVTNDSFVKDNNIYGIHHEAPHSYQCLQRTPVPLIGCYLSFVLKSNLPLLPMQHLAVSPHEVTDEFSTQFSALMKRTSEFSRYLTKFRNCKWPILTCLSSANLIRASSFFTEKMWLREAALLVRPDLEAVDRMEDSFKTYFSARYG